MQKFLLKKEKKNRYIVKNFELKNLILKIFERDLKISKISKLFSLKKSVYINKKARYIRLQNRCVLTNRSYGVFRFFKWSRIKIRENCAKGFIPGLHKASW